MSMTQRKFEVQKNDNILQFIIILLIITYIQRVQEM
jgi:hypothetical protein